MTAGSPIEIVRHLAWGSGLSILIKVANAALAYVMFLVLARVSGAVEYGTFAVAFSAAVSASYIAALGQPKAVMRYWTQWSAQELPEKARAILRLTLFVTCLGSGAAALLILAGGALNLVAPMPWSFAIAAGTALLAVGFGWSEYACAALRCQGYIVLAMAPRDIVWRVLVLGLFGVALIAGWSFSAGALVLTVGGCLLAVVLPQMVMIYRSGMSAQSSCLSELDRKTVTRYSAIMWASTTADLAKNYAGVIIVSGYVGAEAAGGYFAADRTANLLSFLLLAVTLIAGPKISHYHHAGRHDIVRIIVGLSGFTAGAVALVGLAVFAFFGAEILALFDPAYAGYLSVLLVLCLGQLFAAASGPVHVLLSVSGYERMSLILVVTVGVATVTLQVIAAQYYGLLGVAAATAAGFIFISLFAVIFAKQRLDIDSTGLTLVAHYCRDRFLQLSGGKTERS